MDRQKQKIKDKLKHVEFHANWDIENTSNSFQSIQQSIEEHLQDNESFTIEVRFLESYLYMSECKGIIKKEFSKAMDINETAFNLIQQLDDGPIKDGYMSIYLAMCCWFTLKKDQPDIRCFEKLEQLLAMYIEKNQDEDKKKFEASICVTKALAFSMLSLSRYSESACQLKKATETCPDNVEWLFMLGLIKLRMHKISLRKYEFSSSLNSIEGIMEYVLAIKTNHAYAMVILTDIKRRKYEANEQGRVNVEDDYDDEIVDLLTNSKENASRPKILSLVAQCYIHMGRYCQRNKCNKSVQELDSLHLASCSTFTPELKYFSKARKVIDFAKDNFKKAACIFAQEAVLYREEGNTEEELKCLETVIEMKPSNVGALLQKARALLNKGKNKDAFELYDELLVDFNDDKHVFDLFDINRNYASNLVKYKKEFDKACERNSACLEIALKSFVKQTSSLEVEFIEEVDKRVQKVIGHIKKHLEIKRSKNYSCKFQPSLHLAEFHDKLGQLKEACSYYKEALHSLWTSEEHDKNQEIDISLKLITVYIKLGDLCDAEQMLRKIKDAEVKQGNINKLETDLEIAKGTRDSEAGEHAKAMKHFACAAEMGSKEGAKRLIIEMKVLTNHEDIIKNCALVKKCIKGTSGSGSMLDDINELVRSYDYGCLMHADLQKIREYQLDMEYCYLLRIENTGNIDNVIHKCRSSLNHAMTRFKKDNYSEAKNKNRSKDNTDFFIVDKNPKKKIAEKITEIYGWTDFHLKHKEFLDFLVSIQPVTDPKNNNWIKELIKLDNLEKHSHSQEEVDKSFFVARSACSRIRPILEGFCKYFKPQPTSPSQT